MINILTPTKQLISGQPKTFWNALKDRTEPNKIIWTGLTKQEHKLLWKHFNKQGLDDWQIDEEINKIKEQIEESHRQSKLGIKKIDFKEAFNKLIEVRR